MAAEANSREARRRRRILEQGSDRLAFIAGRVNNLPQSSDPPNAPLPPTGTLPLSFSSILFSNSFRDHPIPIPRIYYPDPIPVLTKIISNFRRAFVQFCLIARQRRRAPIPFCKITTLPKAAPPKHLLCMINTRVKMRFQVSQKLNPNLYKSNPHHQHLQNIHLVKTQSPSSNSH